MANVSAYARKQVLDWLLGGAAATQPTSRYLGLSYGSPTSTSGSEVAATGAYTRIPITFTAAASPGGSASLAAAASFAAATYASTLSGWQIWDTQGVGAGNMLWQGLLSAATRPTSLSAFTFAAVSVRLSSL